MASGYVDDRLWAACMDMLGCTGVKALAMGCTPAHPDRWWASGNLASGAHVVMHGIGPVLVVAALTERAALEAACMCGKPILLSDRAQQLRPDGCRWIQEGRTFVPLLPKHHSREEPRL